MTTRERATVCLVLVCDGCGDEYDGSGDYRPHYDSLEDAREEADNASDWRTDGTSDWCRGCQVKPHAFVSDPDDECCCARCHVYIDDHDPAVEVSR